jgi:hypothetical protein
MNQYLLAHQTLVAQLQILTWLAKYFAFLIKRKPDAWFMAQMV